MSDLRSTLRQLRRSPFHIAACLLSLAVGVAVCVAVFSALDSMVFAPIPGVLDRQQLIQIRWAGDAGLITSSEFESIEAGADAVLSAVAAEGDRDLPVALPAGPATKPVGFISTRYFEALRTTPIAGRLLLANDADPGHAPTTVISERLWREAFNTDPAVVGRMVGIGGRFFTVVGITPAGFAGLRIRDIGGTDADYPQLFLPLREAASYRNVLPTTAWLFVQGRLGWGVSVRAAQAELAVIGLRLAERSGSRGKDSRLRAFLNGLDWHDDPWQSTLVVAFYLFVPLCVLAIGCANVMNLQLARSTERARELSVRMALGASRVQLARLLALEVVLLASVAGAIGWRGAEVMLTAMQPWFPTPLMVNRHVLVFVLILVAGVMSVAGVAPACLAARDVLSAGLKEQSAGGFRLKRIGSALVVFQFASCVAFLFISGLALRSLQANGPYVPPDAPQMLIAEFRLADVHPEQPRTHQFIDSIEDSLRSTTAVRSAGFADFFGSDGQVRYWQAADDPATRRIARGGLVTADWFDAAGIKIMAGHGFESTDATGTVGIINESFASAMGESVNSVLGRSLRIAHPLDAQARSVQIVGVVSNRWLSNDGRALPMMFLPMPKSAPASVILIVRALDIDGAGRAVRAAVAAADPAVPIPRLESPDVYLNERVKNIRVMTWFGAELGLLALLLAVAGLYAVMSYTVRRRTREIGIRLAMGALPGQVVALVLRQGFRLVAIGALTGSAVAIPLGFLLRSVFFGTSPVDPQALLSTVGVLALAALIASAVPAYRAATVEPTVALREE